jgi:hypothetical protein
LFNVATYCYIDNVRRSGEGIVAQVISDEVWQRLDPHAGRPSRASLRSLWRATGLALTAVTLVALGWQSGAGAARLEMPREAASEFGGGPGQPLSVVFTVRNVGRTTVTVTGAGRSGVGLELTEVRGPFPATLAPGEQIAIRLAYRLTGCATGPTTAWPVPVRIQGWWWGERTVELEPPWTGNAWQRELTDLVCDPVR